MDQKKRYNYNQALEALLAASLFALVMQVITGFRLFFLVAVVLMVSGLISKRATESIGHSWLFASQSIGALNNRILLTIIFYVILTPLALVYRLLHSDLLQLQKNIEAGSYYINCEHYTKKSDFDKPW